MPIFLYVLDGHDQDLPPEIGKEILCY